MVTNLMRFLVSVWSCLVGAAVAYIFFSAAAEKRSLREFDPWSAKTGAEILTILTSWALLFAIWAGPVCAWSLMGILFRPDPRRERS